jgi:voltage-gated potassium channel
MPIRRRRKSEESKPTKVVPQWRIDAFARFNAAAQVPMLILAVVMIPVLIIPIAMHHLSTSTKNALEAADYLIWAIFFLEYLIKISLAPDRKLFVRKNIPDLIVVAVPFLRPLRVVRSIRALRLLRLTRLSAFAGEGVSGAKKSLHSKSANYVLIVTGALVLLTAVMVLDLDHGAVGSNIKTLPDALWWAVTTITTVGYGDKFPVSPGARAIAVVLMFAGVALYGVLTAAMAAFFVEHGNKPEPQGAAPTPGVSLDELMERLRAIEATLSVIASAPKAAPAAPMEGQG